MRIGRVLTLCLAAAALALAACGEDQTYRPEDPGSSARPALNLTGLWELYSVNGTPVDQVQETGVHSLRCIDIGGGYCVGPFGELTVRSDSTFIVGMRLEHRSGCCGTVGGIEVSGTYATTPDSAFFIGSSDAYNTRIVGSRYEAPAIVLVLDYDDLAFSTAFRK